VHEWKLSNSVNFTKCSGGGTTAILPAKLKAREVYIYKYKLKVYWSEAKLPESP